MIRTHRILLALGLVFAFAGIAKADVVRFRYSPSDLCGHTALKPDPCGGVGEWRPWLFGVRRSSYYCRPNPTHLVTFLHPHTNRHVKVPLALPGGTPQTFTTTEAITFTYTSYSVRVEFRRDGSVDVVYNSGIFRPL